MRDPATMDGSEGVVAVESAAANFPPTRLVGCVEVAEMLSISCRALDCATGT